MALDEALLSERGAPPTLRFYTWEPSALSLGYFQRFEDVPEARHAPAVVRRLTGGGAIHHAEELTFAIAAEQTNGLYVGPVAHSYERVHALLIAAFARLGVRASLRGAGAVTSDDPGSGMCFRCSTPLDLVWDGAKGVGSAQRRTGGRVLHHGSIKLGVSDLEGPIASLRTHAPSLAAEELASAIRDTFAERLAVDFAAAEPTPREWDHAARRAAFFRSEEFVRRR